MPDDLYVLCGACRVIRHESEWRGFEFDPAFEGDGDPPLVPTVGQEEPPFYRCPACGFDHVDDDADPGVWLGTQWSMVQERARLTD